MTTYKCVICSTEVDYAKEASTKCDKCNGSHLTILDPTWVLNIMEKGLRERRNE